jgi:hypothetical protein
MRTTTFSRAARVRWASLAAVAMLAMPAFAGAAPIEVPGKGQLRHFSVLGTEPEGMPPEVAALFAGPETAPPGFTLVRPSCPDANPALAQHLPSPGHRLWVVPGSGCLSLVQSYKRGDLFPVTTGAATTESVVRHGLTAGTSGLVPDGVIAARFGPTVTVPVVDNVFSYPLDEGDALWHHPKLVHGATASE